MANPTTAAFRFGFGLPLPDGAPTQPDAMLAALAGPDPAAQQWPGIGIAEASPALLEIIEARSSDDTSAAAVARLKAAQRAMAAQVQKGVRVSFARALDAPDGFRERLVRFWANHFTVRARSARERSMPSALIEDAIRPHVAGTFPAMLAAVTLHPAMLSYLDQLRSVGPGSRAGLKHRRGLNENLAREVLELHSMGAGSGYTQGDVTELAALLTGLSAARDGTFLFKPEMAEPGGETVLGRVYAGEGTGPILSALHDLATRPETARHIAAKIAAHFIADTPEPALVAALAAEFAATGGDLLAVYGVLLRHPAAWQPATLKARQPDEFLVAALRGLGLGGGDVMALSPRLLQRVLLTPLAAMGRPWQAPGGPDGFPEEAAAWITPQGLAERIVWAMEVPHLLVGRLPDAAPLAEHVLGERADARLLWAIARAETARDAAGMVLASTAFNRR